MKGHVQVDFQVSYVYVKGHVQVDVVLSLQVIIHLAEFLALIFWLLNHIRRDQKVLGTSSFLYLKMCFVFVECVEHKLVIFLSMLLLYINSILWVCEMKDQHQFCEWLCLLESIPVPINQLPSLIYYLLGNHVWNCYFLNAYVALALLIHK